MSIDRKENDYLGANLIYLASPILDGQGLGF